MKMKKMKRKRNSREVSELRKTILKPADVASCNNGGPGGPAPWQGCKGQRPAENFEILKHI